MITRRSLLGGIAAFAPLSAHATVEVEKDKPQCEAMPSIEEVTNYRPDQLIKQELHRIDEDLFKQGEYIELTFRIFDATNCVDGIPTPIMGASVELWHADGLGAYSEGEETWCRGIQLTNTGGFADFFTIFPCRDVTGLARMHYAVHINGTTVHTGELIFEDALVVEIMQTEPYIETLDDGVITSIMTVDGPTEKRDHEHEYNLVQGQYLFPLSGELGQILRGTFHVSVNPSASITLPSGE